MFNMMDSTFEMGDTVHGEDGSFMDLSNASVFEADEQVEVPANIAKEESPTTSKPIKKSPATTYECDTCKKTYSRADQLKRHIEGMHGNRIKCKACSRCFESIEFKGA